MSLAQHKLRGRMSKSNYEIMKVRLLKTLQTEGAMEKHQIRATHIKWTFTAINETLVNMELEGLIKIQNNLVLITGK